YPPSFRKYRPEILIISLDISILKQLGILSLHMILTFPGSSTKRKVLSTVIGYLRLGISTTINILFDHYRSLVVPNIAQSISSKKKRKWAVGADEALRKEMVIQFHASVIAGHNGGIAVLQRARLDCRLVQGFAARQDYEECMDDGDSRVAKEAKLFDALEHKSVVIEVDNKKIAIFTKAQLWSLGTISRMR
ncbi:hypothetical protein Tco_0256463, partial [Tanacetum coccineum]